MGDTSEIWSLLRGALWGPSRAECKLGSLNFRLGNPPQNQPASGQGCAPPDLPPNLPSCYPDRRFHPHHPVAWRLEGKRRPVKGIHQLPGHCPPWFPLPIVLRNRKESSQGQQDKSFCRAREWDAPGKHPTGAPQAVAMHPLSGRVFKPRAGVRSDAVVKRQLPQSPCPEITPCV